MRLDLYMILVLQNLWTTNPSRPIPVSPLCDLLLSLLQKAAHPPVVNQTKGFCLLHRYLLLEFLLGVTTHLIWKCLRRFLVAASDQRLAFGFFFFFVKCIYTCDLSSKGGFDQKSDLAHLFLSQPPPPKFFPGSSFPSGRIQLAWPRAATALHPYRSHPDLNTALPRLAAMPGRHEERPERMLAGQSCSLAGIQAGRT